MFPRGEEMVENDMPLVGTAFKRKSILIIHICVPRAMNMGKFAL